MQNIFAKIPRSLQKHGLAQSIRLFFKYEWDFITIKSFHFYYRLRNPLNLPGSQRDVVFIVDYLSPPSQRYRVNNISEYLTQAGIKSQILYVYEIQKYMDYVLSFDIIIIFRTPIKPLLQELIAKAKKLNKKILFSCDDLIFDPKTTKEWVKIPKNVKPGTKIYYEKQAKSFSKTFQLCDYFLASTKYLASRAEKLGKKSFYIPNALNQKQIDVYQDISKKPKIKSDNIILGYFSGTKTHDADFDLISPILIQILKKYPNVSLFIVGYLKLHPKFNKFKKQIKRHSLVHWAKLPYLINKVDINLVPLVNNQLNQGKSELKYFESGILKIPTIASETDTYKRVIQNGENGFLCKNLNDWRINLESLIENPALRKKIGENAYLDILKKYTPEIMAKITAKEFSKI